VQHSKGKEDISRSKTEELIKGVIIETIKQQACIEDKWWIRRVRLFGSGPRGAKQYWFEEDTKNRFKQNYKRDVLYARSTTKKLQCRPHKIVTIPTIDWNIGPWKRILNFLKNISRQYFVLLRGINHITNIYILKNFSYFTKLVYIMLLNY